ncbi:sin-like protein conserved region domain-containing protein [Ditylenchus destructor]|uniref:Sin-like protein conserved region domain-containing protein n=1 Tax=Ditylenchus destructor TaxID=166010 RepID=A0AAD4R3Y1_9BILA|nr:sin-like protein conserved region domain-containing protein [Ditylenchus destructor]
MIYREYHGDGYSHPEMINTAAGFFKNGKLVLIPVRDTYEMHCSVTKPVSEGIQYLTENVQEMFAPVRVKFKRAESKAKKMRRQQSARHALKLFNKEPWMDLNVEEKVSPTDPVLSQPVTTGTTSMPPKPRAAAESAGKTPKKKKLDSDKTKNTRDIELESDKKLDSSKGKITQDVVGEDETTVFVRVNAKIQPAKSKLHVNKNFAKTMQDAGKAYEEETGKQETSMRSPVTGVQMSREEELKNLLSEFKALQEENNEHVNILQQLKKEVRSQHDALQRDSCRLYDFLSECGCGIKPANGNQEINKSQRLGVVAEPQVSYKKVNHMSKGQAIPRFVPEDIAEATTPPNAAPAANDASVRKAKNDVTSCYSYYFYDLLKSSVLGQETPITGSGNKTVSNGQGTNKSQRQNVVTAQKVRYKKEISMVRGKSIPRFIPEMIQPQASPNPIPKKNVAASSNAATGTKTSGLPANNPANGPAAQPGVRNPQNDSTDPTNINGSFQSILSVISFAPTESKHEFIGRVMSE